MRKLLALWLVAGVIWGLQACGGVVAVAMRV